MGRRPLANGLTRRKVKNSQPNHVGTPFLSALTRPHRHVLHDARTGAGDWERKGPADILWPDACAGSLSETLMAEAKKK